MAGGRWRPDLIATGLLLSGLTVAVSVFSYDPSDPAHAIAFPSQPAGGSFLGPAGAWLAQNLFDTLGLAVYVLLVSWFVLVLLLYLRKSWLRWSLRLAGWLLLIPCAAVAADILALNLPWVTLTGPGGSVGASLNGELAESFSSIGRWSVFGGCMLLGLMLTADFALIWLARRLAKASYWSFRGVRDLVRWLDGPSRAASDAPLIKHYGTLEAAQNDFTRAAGSAAKAPAVIPIRHHDEAIASLTESSRRLKPAASVLPARSEEEHFAGYELPPLTLLEDPQPFPYEEHDQRLRERAALLEKTFTDFGLNVRVVGINTGPVITQYEVALETGLRVHKVTNLSDDLALNLKVPSVRIVAPIPGKNTVGIEIPNEHRAVVRLKEVLLTAGKRVAKAKVPLFLGKDTEGRPLFYDLAEMPHLLIAGRTGTGKSVCMNAIILSILMTRRPDEVKMVMIDPKMLELSEYGKIPHLMHPVVKDMRKAEAILSWAVDKMEERYDLLSRARVRGIAAYNELSLDEILRRVEPDDEERSRIPERMPYIVLFVDEMNDLMMTMRREVEGHIIRLAQKSRAAGIHLVVATQKPTVDVITGLIKSNLPARICFQVSSRTDSRVVLDEMGADKLLGKGDMLFLQPGTSTLIRAQGTYASDEEITRVVEHLQCEPCYAQELIQLSANGQDGKGQSSNGLRVRDELYEQAIEVIVREGRGSVSLLQRALGIGYGRAARLIDFMAEDGIVGDYNGSQAREVLYSPEKWEQLKQASSPTSN
jgi:S-DNA-T family DNA segregation ATPase FtsK/SpoIIIE